MAAVNKIFLNVMCESATRIPHSGIFPPVVSLLPGLVTGHCHQNALWYCKCSQLPIIQRKWFQNFSKFRLNNVTDRIVSYDKVMPCQTTDTTATRSFIKPSTESHTFTILTNFACISFNQDQHQLHRHVSIFLTWRYSKTWCSIQHHKIITNSSKVTHVTCRYARVVLFLILHYAFMSTVWPVKVDGTETFLCWKRDGHWLFSLPQLPL
jgi:hypothetical protein